MRYRICKIKVQGSVASQGPRPPGNPRVDKMMAVLAGYIWG